MFKKILIANRGEIACRVARTARRLGVGTVAVYSDADAAAMHVGAADEAVHIGGAAPKESYLRIDAILDAARRTGAEAIHPGYGFLSENAGFAEACAKAGIVFIGPPAAAIRAMGGKGAAKALMEKAGVPITPGYHGAEQSPERLAAEAARIGYPVLIKAVAGGGGKGMARVDRPGDFAAALAGAKRVAANAFADDTVLVEKYVENPRHVEIQVFADTQGGAVYLFERDCSVQRRHQKVIEEAPAPGLADETRRRMGEAAVAAAKAIGYVGAGTVEFIYGAGTFYFMEMNTRLQVEHPVTELITGLDLVEWQLRVAAGEPLPLTQDGLRRHGHALEARLYAEDPQRDFLPAPGPLVHLAFPESSPLGPVRVDTGVRAGDTVTPFYDPMIAKLVVWGQDRPTALRRMAAALAECEIAGTAANVDFLAAIVTHPEFAKGGVDTGFIGKNLAALLAPTGPSDDDALAIAALFVEHERAEAAKRAAAVSGDPYSPWHAVSGWRVNDEAHHRLVFELAGARREVIVASDDGGFRLSLGAGAPVGARATPEADGRLAVSLGGRRLAARVVRHGERLAVFALGRRRDLVHVDAMTGFDAMESDEKKLTAPMSGKVIAVIAKDGAKVERGQPLLIVEAMKMEHTIAAPADGTVKQVRYRVGDQVEEGAELVDFEKAEA
jgi:3-methylcrotonyl-CoA carboxylase alpha subunit